MPKISFKAFITFSLIIIVFTPILLAKTVTRLTDVYSSKESQIFDLDLWVQDNIVNADKTQFNKEEWKSQLKKKAEADKLDLFIILQMMNCFILKE